MKAGTGIATALHNPPLVVAAYTVTKLSLHPAVRVTVLVTSPRGQKTHAVRLCRVADDSMAMSGAFLFHLS